MHFSLFTIGTALLGSAAGVPLTKHAALTQVTDFTASNPTGALMYIYVPDNLASNPPVIVALHNCQGTAESYFTGSPYAELADQYGFIVVYPESGYTGTCWDVASQASLTHDGGGNSQAVADMVAYTLDTYNGDASQVFVTGSSSGAMMTNVMAATYPELFKAATAYSGVPAGCFSSPGQPDAPPPGAEPAWNSTCAQGSIDASPEYWTGVVEAMYPGYTGARPRFQVYHGSLDEILHAPNYEETVKEWTGVFGYDYTAPESTQENFPEAGYTTQTWGVSDANPLGTVQGIYAEGVGHTVPINGTMDMMWFGLGPYASESGSTPATPSAPSNATTGVAPSGSVGAITKC